MGGLQHGAPSFRELAELAVSRRSSSTTATNARCPPKHGSVTGSRRARPSRAGQHSYWWRPPHSSHTARSRSWVSACWDGGQLAVTLSRTASVLVTVRLTDNAQQVALAAGKRGRSGRCSQDSCTCNSANGTRSASSSDSSSASVEAHPNHGRCGTDRPDVKTLEMAWGLGPQFVDATTTQPPEDAHRRTLIDAPPSESQASGCGDDRPMWQASATIDHQGTDAREQDLGPFQLSSRVAASRT